jgi:hypothetical protein
LIGRDAPLAHILLELLGIHALFIIDGVKSHSATFLGIIWTATPAGHRFNVLRTEGNWVGTLTNVNGREVSGWLWRGQVATPQQFATRQRAPRYSYQPGTAFYPGTAVRRYSFAPAIPGAATPYRGPYPYRTNTLPQGMAGDYITGGLRSDSPLIMGATKYGRNYWRADRKIIGY